MAFEAHFFRKFQQEILHNCSKPLVGAQIGHCIAEELFHVRTVHCIFD